MPRMRRNREFNEQPGQYTGTMRELSADELAMLPEDVRQDYELRRRMESGEVDTQSRESAQRFGESDEAKRIDDRRKRTVSERESGDDLIIQPYNSSASPAGLYLFQKQDADDKRPRIVGGPFASDAEAVAAKAQKLDERRKRAEADERAMRELFGQ